MSQADWQYSEGSFVRFRSSSRYCFVQCVAAFYGRCQGCNRALRIGHFELLQRLVYWLRGRVRWLEQDGPERLGKAIDAQGGYLRLMFWLARSTDAIFFLCHHRSTCR